jgi:hypothetical protein
MSGALAHALRALGGAADEEHGFHTASKAVAEARTKANAKHKANAKDKRKAKSVTKKPSMADADSTGTVEYPSGEEDEVLGEEEDDEAEEDEMEN